MRDGKALYRDAEKGKLAGVCVGIADYFGIETWLVRIIVVSGFFLSGSFFLVAYVAAWFILDKKLPGEKRSNVAHSLKGSGKGWQNPTEASEGKVEVKAKVWQAGEPPRQAFRDIKGRYKVVEERLRKVESYVTSKEFQLNRELSRL